MVGRGAIAHPWIFREARARLAGMTPVGPTDDERRALYRSLLDAAVGASGEGHGVASAKKYIAVLGPRFDRQRLLRATTVTGTLEVLAQAGDPRPLSVAV
jgi:tRNA-dihydrouridine synthase B